jgi:hypothetical protein
MNTDNARHAKLPRAESVATGLDATLATLGG